MIKSWLRSQPAPAQQRVEMVAEGAQAAAQGLSLSMNMAAGMPQHLGGERGVLESVSTSTQGGMAARKEDAIGASSTGSGAVVSAGADSTSGSGGTVVAQLFPFFILSPHDVSITLPQTAAKR
jgi:hypothetical protein